MKAEDIERYLSQLGQELQKRGIQRPIHLLIIGGAYMLPWLNYLTQLLMYDMVIIPDGKPWKMYGPIHIYVPSPEYILALKIFAGREKDIEDCKILLQQGTITTREQALKSLERYILPDALQQNTETVEKSLDTLFGKGHPLESISKREE
jgi:hypothetical protein